MAEQRGFFTPAAQPSGIRSMTIVTEHARRAITPEEQRGLDEGTLLLSDLDLFSFSQRYYVRCQDGGGNQVGETQEGDLLADGVMPEEREQQRVFSDRVWAQMEAEIAG